MHPVRRRRQALDFDRRGSVAPDHCPFLDASGDGGVNIAELVAAVANALAGCPLPENVLVNDRTGEEIDPRGSVQSETSIAVSGSDIVVDYNDSKGSYDPMHGIAGYSYSTDGGRIWTNAGDLGSGFYSDPSVVFCGDAFYYADLYVGGTPDHAPTHRATC